MKKPRETMSSVRAQRIARAKTEEHLLKKIEGEAYKSPEFEKMISDLFNAEGIILENKISIAIEMLGYWITGENDKARGIYGKLFNERGIETFEPSE